MTIIPIHMESVQLNGNVPIKVKFNIKKYIKRNISKINSIYITKVFIAFLLLIVFINIPNNNLSVLYSSILHNNINSNVLDINIVQKQIYLNDVFDMLMIYNISKNPDSNYIHFVLTFDTNYLKITDENNNIDNIVQDIYLFETISKYKIDQLSSTGVLEFEGFDIKQNINKNNNILSILKFIALQKGDTILNLVLYDKDGKIIEDKDIKITIN